MPPFKMFALLEHLHVHVDVDGVELHPQLVHVYTSLPPVIIASVDFASPLTIILKEVLHVYI